MATSNARASPRQAVAVRSPAACLRSRVTRQLARRFPSQRPPGDQVWFHHNGYVHDVAAVVAVILTAASTGTLGLQRPPCVWIRLHASPSRRGHISKTEINKRRGYAVE